MKKKSLSPWKSRKSVDPMRRAEEASKKRFAQKTLLVMEFIRFKIQMRINSKTINNRFIDTRKCRPFVHFELGYPRRWYSIRPPICFVQGLSRFAQQQSPFMEIYFAKYLFFLFLNIIIII